MWIQDLVISNVLSLSVLANSGQSHWTAAQEEEIICLKRYYFHKGKTFWAGHRPGSRAVSFACKWFLGSWNTPRISEYLWILILISWSFYFAMISSFFLFLAFPEYLPGHRYWITPFCVPGNPTSQTVDWIQGPAHSLPCPHHWRPRTKS